MMGLRVILLLKKIKTQYHGDSCVKQCNTDLTNCWRGCDGDALCEYECSVQGYQCIDACPCSPQCPNGCDDCANSIFVCAHPDADPDYVTCADWVEFVYIECFVGCSPGNVDCVSECARTYNTMISQCPCQVRVFFKRNCNLLKREKAECPSGCPCETYQCPAITSTLETTTTAVTTTTTELTTSPSTDNLHILAIWYKSSSSSNAILTDSNGVTTSIRWGDEGEVSAASFCALTFQNQFYILG